LISDFARRSLSWREGIVPNDGRANDVIGIKGRNV